MKKIYNYLGIESLLIGLITLEIILFFFLMSFFNPFVMGDIGQDVTVSTFLEVGTVFPEVLNVSINYYNDVVLVANSTRVVSCISLIRDYNNESNLGTVSAEIFDSSVSFFGDTDDNNYHYTNSSCVIENITNDLFGVTDDEYHVLGNCSFEVYYYANAGEWNCTLTVVDKDNLNDTGYGNGSMAELLSVGLPSSINYGIVNSTYVSEEQIANVTNFGNVEINLSLSGYAVTEGDGYAMNCTQGNIQNISINYEKFNITEDNSGYISSLSEFENLYTNLSASAPFVVDFGLASRQDDVVNEAVNSTYWRIYVPKGVAGTCSGNIVFGATQAQAD